MGKRKRKSGKRQSSNALLRNGLRDFKKGNYNETIEGWEQVVRQTPDMQPTSALAEAYFRRGLKRIYGQGTGRQGGLDDLRQAAKLQPHDRRYTYHLGLAAHHQGDLDAAISAYQTVREGEGELADRAAYPLALAMQQQGASLTDTPAWSALSDEEQTMLSDVKTFQRRPYSPSSDAPLLWRGLAALDAGDYKQARSALEAILENPANDAERRMAHYYQGVLAAKEENWDDARRQWNAARSAGLASPRLAENLGEVYHRMAEKRLASDDVESALAAAEEALRHKTNSNSLQNLISQAHQRLAYQAASAGDWAVAHAHWKAARETEGGSFRLSYNAALAHERAEEFIAAAEEWREALRRRPRRDDHPDAVADEDVSQLWRRAAESYTRAGEYDEAVQVYRTAVKWDPDNLKARLALSEALLYNGQTQAAENELNRILERDPDNVPALLQQGEVVAASRSWWRGKDPSFYWKQALALEPHNLNARQLLIDFHQNEAESALSWRNYARAVVKYEQALEYQPQNGPILAALGGCYLRMGDEHKDDAQARFEQALTNAPANLDVYDEIIHAWLDAGEPDQAWSVMEQADVSIDRIPYEFCVTQASYGIQDYGPEVIRPWLERAVEKAPPGEPILNRIGEMAMMADVPEIAQEYLERAIAADQDPGYAYLALGMLAAQDGDDRTASQHWRKAERIARRKRDAELRERVEIVSLFFNAPPGLLEMISQLGPPPGF